jgi:ketosteroid isomerase-like protein
MLDRAEILRTIDEAYAARMRGDKAALLPYWAPEATYRLAGAEELIPAPFPVGPADAHTAAVSLIDLFQFHKLERLHAVVEGPMASVHWRVTVSTAGKSAVTTEMYDLWTFTEGGKVCSLLQFVDTALLATMLA